MMVRKEQEHSSTQLSSSLLTQTAAGVVAAHQLLLLNLPTPVLLLTLQLQQQQPTAETVKQQLQHQQLQDRSRTAAAVLTGPTSRTCVQAMTYS